MQLKSISRWAGRELLGLVALVTAAVMLPVLPASAQAEVHFAPVDPAGVSAVAEVPAVKSTQAVPAPPGSNRNELVRIMDELQDLITILAMQDSLNGEELNNTQRELALIYRDLEALAARLEGSAQPPAQAGLPAADDTWLPYEAASRRVSPADAQFKGWGERSLVEQEFGKSGELKLHIEGGYYTADWTIREAYRGEVNTRISSQQDGKILLTVADADGQHEFMLRDGGLGGLFYRGWAEAASAAPAKTVSPVASSVSIQSTRWYGSYRELVAAGSLGQSREMEWLIDQTESGEYVSSELAELGERLNQLTGTAILERLGEMKYPSGNQTRFMEIPDPRANPASFIMLISKVFNLEQEGRNYSFKLD